MINNAGQLYTPTAVQFAKFVMQNIFALQTKQDEIFDVIFSNVDLKTSLFGSNNSNTSKLIFGDMITDLDDAFFKFIKAE